MVYMKKDFTKLLVYEKSYSLAMEIFEISKSFPKEETYSLTDQIRRASRSVCSNLAESYRKRRYPLHFISKLTDCDSENSETLDRLSFAFDCHYLDREKYHDLCSRNNEIGKLINYMINNPQKFSQK